MNQPQLIESIFKFIKEFRSRLDEELVLAKLEFNPVFFKVLKLVANIPDCTAQKITSIFEKDKALITRIIKEMVSLDLLTQNRDKKDSRKKILTLTPKGKNSLSTFRKIEVKIEESMTSTVSSEDLDTFLRVLNKFSGNIT